MFLDGIDFMTPYVLALVGLGIVATPTIRPDSHAQDKPPSAETAGFAQTTTDYHFYLYEDGGAIEVAMKNRKDVGSLARIRAELAQIAQKLAAGDLAMPGFIRGDAVPGTDGLKRLRDRISYAYEETRDGGRVRIRTRHARGLLAVHEFLRFQIRDHKTGDPEHVTAEKKEGTCLSNLCANIREPRGSNPCRELLPGITILVQRQAPANRHLP